MTSTTTDLTTVPTEILKTDCKGRIRFPAKMREELLDRFERSGMSGAEFAAYYGVKYTTFASWRQKRERDQKNVHPAKRGVAGKPEECTLIEVTLQEEPKPIAIRVELPGGSTMQVTNKAEAALAAEVLKMLESC